MTLGSSELFDLFLALCPARLGAARRALEEPDRDQRLRDLQAALVPLSVDAALLGAEGVSALARAIGFSTLPARPELEAALSELEQATSALESGDASGARTDESRLLALSATLVAGSAASRAEARVPELERISPAAPAGDTELWVPALPEDMVGAFLDECFERTEALSERLLLLEQRGADRELVDAIFRDLHTLKGSSGFAGLRKLNRVAHRAEDLVGELREGRRPLDKQLVSALLQALDALRAILERARQRQPVDVDVGPVLLRLEDPSRAGPSPPPAEAAPAKPSPKGAGQETLRIEFEKVDHLLNLVGEIVLARGRLSGAADVQQALLHELGQLRKRLGGVALSDEFERMDRLLLETFRDLEAGLGGLGLSVGQLRDTVLKLRMVPIARLFSKYQRTVRELSQALDKSVTVTIAGGETELDKVLVERLEDPILHLVRNAVDHGIEAPSERVSAGKGPAGRLTLEARQRGGQILVRVSDDGRGLDAERLRRKAVERALLGAEEAASLSVPECYQLIFRPGFSTADRLSEISGRGVGMDVVKEAVAALKGTIEIRSEPGRGTTFELVLPLTLSISQVLTARVGSEIVAVPLDAVVSAQTLSPGQLEDLATGRVFRLGDELLPALDLAQALGLGAGAGEHQSAIVVTAGSTRAALLVHKVLGRHEVVLKSLGPVLSRAPCAAGAALIGERMVLVVDLGELLASSRAGAPLPPAPPGRRAIAASGRLLLVEDSDVVRDNLRRELERAGFEVVPARDGTEALALAAGANFDAVSTDVMMPGLDGYALTRRLRELPQYRNVPIVMVTSKGTRLDRARGEDAGADAYLDKPVDAGELARTLASLIARNERRAAAARAPGTG